MAFNKINFKLYDELKKIASLPNLPERRTWASPDEFSILPEFVVDSQLIPDAFQWKNNDVIHWIESIGFPEYRLTFHENMINGRNLLLIDASALTRMNITNFEHIKAITKAIRNLYKIEKTEFQRSISLPPNLPDTHFKLYRVFTGPKYERCRRSELWRKMKILRVKTPYMDHWTKLTEWLKHVPDFQSDRIGYAPRHQLYFVKPEGKKIETITKPAEKVVCDCECKWNNKNYKSPWRLTCLKKRGILVPEVRIKIPPVIQEDIKFIECNCIPPCECGWQERERQNPWILSLLKRK